MKNRNYKVYYRFLRFKMNCFLNKEIAEQKQKQEQGKIQEEKIPPFCIDCKHFHCEKHFSPVCVRNVGKIMDIDIVTGKTKVFSVSDAPYCSTERIDFQTPERRQQQCSLDAQFFVRKT